MNFEAIVWAGAAYRFGEYLLNAMSKNTGPLEDVKRKSPQLEEKRVWGHGNNGKIIMNDGTVGNNDCSRKEKPVYTNPQKVPHQCRGCYNEDWDGKGRVLRDKETKQIVREIK